MNFSVYYMQFALKLMILCKSRSYINLSVLTAYKENKVSLKFSAEHSFWCAPPYYSSEGNQVAQMRRDGKGEVCKSRLPVAVRKDDEGIFEPYVLHRVMDTGTLMMQRHSVKMRSVCIK